MFTIRYAPQLHGVASCIVLPRCARHGGALAGVGALVGRPSRYTATLCAAVTKDASTRLTHFLAGSLWAITWHRA
jgi:hypothetical protein